MQTLTSQKKEKIDHETTINNDATNSLKPGINISSNAIDFVISGKPGQKVHWVGDYNDWSVENSLILCLQILFTFSSSAPIFSASSFWVSLLRILYTRIFWQISHLSLFSGVGFSGPKLLPSSFFHEIENNFIIDSLSMFFFITRINNGLRNFYFVKMKLGYFDTFLK